MSKVHYSNHKTLKARFIDSSQLGDFLPRMGSLGELLLRDCVKERGKNEKKTIEKYYHAIFTYSEILESPKIEPPQGTNIIYASQPEEMKISASFSTPDERSEWLETTFKIIE